MCSSDLLSFGQTSITLANVAPTTVNAFGAATTINVGNNFNSGTGVFTCPVAGVYQVTATAISLGYNSTPAPTQKLEWWKNYSTTNISSRAQNPASITSESFDTPLVATGYVQCNAGDLLQAIIAADANGQIDNNNSTLNIRLVS